jgi:hypothetical protein
VRADDEALRISIPYNLQEWLFLQKQLPNDIGKKARWVPGVTSKQGSLPVLLVKHLGMDGEDQVEYLTQLFTHLSKIINETAKAQAGS